MVKHAPKIIPLVPAKRCPDFDSECADVTSHLDCWNNWMLGVADGYCPYLIGEKDADR